MLSTSHPEIIEFFNNCNINFETAIIQLIIQPWKNIMNANSQENIKSELQHSISQLNSKFNDFQKESMENMKLILNANNTEKIFPLIKETNDRHIDKTSILLANILPQSQANFKKDISELSNNLQYIISSETNKLLSSSMNSQNITDFLTNIQGNIQQSQQTLISLLSNSETRIDNRLIQTEQSLNNFETRFGNRLSQSEQFIQELKSIITNNQYEIHTLIQKNNELIKKFEKGTGKGNISENILYNILLELYPNEEINYVGNQQKETGDIIIILESKIKILLENKDYDSKLVPKPEIEKFIRDCDIQNCSGIMFSQHLGITNKQNFEHQIHKGNVLLFVHNTDFDKGKIKFAIEAVKQIKLKYDEINNAEDNCIIIDAQTLENIHSEYICHIKQINDIKTGLRDDCEKRIKQLDESTKFPNLEKIISPNFATSSNQHDNVCSYCGKSFKYLKAFEKHILNCSTTKNN